MMFDFSSVSSLVKDALFLHKLTDYGLSAGYVNYFLSYVTADCRAFVVMEFCHFHL
jgi:hypothetical protein